MTTHPEAAMTREQMLEEALRPFAEYADRNRRLPADHIVTQGSGFAKRQLTMGDCYAAADALASTRQEPTPAPAADAEEISRMIDAGIKAVNLFEKANINLINRTHLQKFMRAALAARASGEKAGGAQQ